ncbi:MAG: hypothetical protein COW00_15045 [Bdellovibrio sp. CG12_big_fil_rev_8_21_14_0_65_39_13]|nr:MAG: hypothetical protein COW78_00600 [Bdellovibrio sp. CG22_combo_CG10-13_8_21_14_all_39_27]PIQ58608.1 MAG: hypothetical protein COW00_15045 [Bdellovibrio sp. CG12_big_fil_rev_8_21_14_0_65_39_13]PIR33816.1 MAG: hypothetical protein COV37_15005 [Bdellovibrio sp. CG11_big_fil_rev_8_21_14_0_20_39_38]
MTSLIESFFWFIFFLICFHYFIFNLIVIVLGSFKNDKRVNQTRLPKISFIVAAYNEERIIAQKIENDLQSDYPQEHIQYIIVSDGSQDNTHQIVESYANRGIISLYQPQRQGKTAALNRAVAQATGEIVVFSDANSMFRKDALHQLVKHFHDDDIGGVCGRKSVLSNQDRKASLGDHLYWNYESSLKQAESKLGSIPTADGEIFALRKELYSPIDPKMINDDMVITFNILQAGKRVIYEKNAITEEEASINLKDDFNVKSRMIYGGIQFITQYQNELNPLRTWFGFQFFIHKTLRYFMWILLIAVYITNIFLLSKNVFYFTFFCLQSLFYLMALIGYILDKKNRAPGIFYLPYYYCNVNLAAYKGYQYFLKQQSTINIWTKAER